MRQDILKIFSIAELSAMSITGEVQTINGYYFTSDSALTMTDRAEVLKDHVPANGVISHQLASWLLCCRFVPPRQTYYSARPGMKLKHETDPNITVFNSQLKLTEILKIGEVLVTNPIRTFTDVLFSEAGWTQQHSSELYSLQRLAKINNEGLQKVLETNHYKKRGLILLDEYFEQLRSLDSVNIINPVDPTYRIK